MKRRPTGGRYLLCVRNDGFATSLLPRRLYERLSDRAAEAHGMVRVVDESGEDYLYPHALFMELELPRPVMRAIAA